MLEHQTYLAGIQLWYVVYTLMAPFPSRSHFFALCSRLGLGQQCIKGRRISAIYTRRVARQYSICWLKKNRNGTVFSQDKNLKFLAPKSSWTLLKFQLIWTTFIPKCIKGRRISAFMLVELRGNTATVG